MSLIAELEHLKKQFTEDEIDNERCGSALLKILNRFLDDISLDNRISEIISNTNSNLSIKLENIRKKNIEVRANNFKEDKEQLDKLRMELRHIIFIFFKEYKEYQEQLKNSMGQIYNRFQAPLSAPHGKDKEKIAETSDIPLRNNEEAKRAIDQIFDIADEVVPGASHEERIQIALYIFQRAKGREAAEPNLGLRRA